MFNAVFKCKAHLGSAYQIVRLGVLSLPACTGLKSYMLLLCVCLWKSISCVGSYDCACPGAGPS